MTIPKRKKVKNKIVLIKEVNYIKLVDIVKKRGKAKKVKSDEAYEEIENRIKPKIMYIVRQFYIPGCNEFDILQEALFALRFKAIPDYNKNKMGKKGLYPFDKFAILCIRRHLSTLLKSSFQNKRKALNTSLSLDQDRSEQSEKSLFLIDIIPKTEGTILDDLKDKEYYTILLRKLYQKLSKFEKKVLKLYVYKYSYDQITKILNDYYKDKGIKRKLDIKSIDNALSRLKQKAKEIYEKYGS